MPAQWLARVDQEFAADNVTRGERDALRALASFEGRGGEIYPSQASVAARANCSERTVRRAITMGVALGLVVVLPRRRWVRGRYVRTSNRYIIGVPDRAVVPGQRPPWPCRASTGQIGQRQDSVSKEEALNEMLRAAAAAPDLLLARREVMQLRQIAGGTVGVWTEGRD